MVLQLRHAVSRRSNNRSIHSSTDNHRFVYPLLRHQYPVRSPSICLQNYIFIEMPFKGVKDHIHVEIVHT
ncbi:hypothetical protein KKB18_12590, partial [bacterium]|nr:hypothetical protein [bacterium]